MGGDRVRYWKGKTGTNKEGMCGVMDNNGSVPDSTKATKSEYEQHIAAQPKIKPVHKIVEFEDIDTGKIYRFKQR